MSRAATRGGPRVTYRRNFYPSGRSDAGKVFVYMMDVRGSLQPRTCAVCGNPIEVRAPRYVDRNGGIDHIHLACPTTVTEVEPEART